MSNFLEKKGNKGGLERTHQVGKDQPVGPLPHGGLNNSGMETLNNTKAPGTDSQPQGKDHAKVVTAPKNLKHGQYL